MARTCLRGLVVSVISLACVTGLLLARGDVLAGWLTTPSGSFWSQSPPRPPDYADPANWSALPARRDGADALPPGSNSRDRQDSAAVDCFYIHPTTYFLGGGWNARTDLWLTNRATDQGPVAQQASAFNGAARVYAPRYRQLTMAGYGEPEARRNGLALAYGDVHRAFRHFLESYSDGRPFFLASHSQGTNHLERLLTEEIAGSPLADRMIAAYAIGASVEEDPLLEAGLPLCDGPDATGCVIGWNTFVEGGDPKRLDPSTTNRGQLLCTNPLSWRLDGKPIGRDANLGAMGMVGLGGLRGIDPKLVGAHCRDGFLWIERPEAPGYDQVLFPGGSYHTYDFNLFYMNIRENAERRARAFLDRVSS
jgi:hypothetical protein